MGHYRKYPASLISQQASPGLADVPFAAPRCKPSAALGIRHSWVFLVFHRIQRVGTLAAAAAGPDIPAPYGAALDMAAPLAAGLHMSAPLAAARCTQLVTAASHSRQGMNPGRQCEARGCTPDSR